MYFIVIHIACHSKLDRSADIVYNMYIKPGVIDRGIMFEPPVLFYTLLIYEGDLFS